MNETMQLIRPSARHPMGRAASMLGAPHFFSLQRGESLEKLLLEHPHTLYIEAGLHESVEKLLASSANRSFDLSVSLRSPTAYSHPVAAVIAAYLDRRFGLQRFRSMQIETCIQEAVINAVVHGNLEIGSDFDSVDTLGEHYAKVENRLQVPPYSQRYITVTALERDESLTISVYDQGGGFDLQDCDPETNLPHGRGLMFIRTLADQVWIGEDGSSIHMRFLY